MRDFDHQSPTRPLGATGLHITPLTIGGAPLGSMPGNFGREIPPELGIATALAALRGPVRALDTSAAYGAGESERRIGAAIQRAGGLPDGFVLSTKIVRDLVSGTFDGPQARRSIAESLRRLGLDQVPLLYLHDPEKNDFEQIMARGGPVDVLRELRDRGVARSIGVAGGEVATIERYVRTGFFDVVLTHNRWTLVNRSAGPLIALAASMGLGVVNAAVFGGGILAAGAAASPRYAYRQAPDELLAAIDAMEEACHDHKVPLAAAAIQFSTRDPRIASTIIGASRPERVGQAVALASMAVPDTLWDDLGAIAARVDPATLPA
ncbi:oxidoreductase [Acrocarpospora pleiomorpha]|uniref:Oxidoreductase n=1 Tax=Acrocarpospora pleiomorpha TaxID=90975 RepID=A0A5M3X8N2_9ACTN|nr:aldo/keto reductase [Acrocarpospora pleiomorpha]GES17454.1 oxidoreductase [Acrocarpospora pleiomorpha]